MMSFKNCIRIRIAIFWRHAKNLYNNNVKTIEPRTGNFTPRFSFSNARGHVFLVIKNIFHLLFKLIHRKHDWKEDLFQF